MGLSEDAMGHPLETETDAEAAARLFAKVGKLKAQNVRYRAWVDDLHSGMYVNCVYCGHRYGPSDVVPSSMADELREHVEKCPDHPMSKLKEEIGRWGKAAREQERRWREAQESGGVDHGYIFEPIRELLKGRTDAGAKRAARVERGGQGPH